MRRRISAVLGYGAAAVTLLVALLTPFVLLGVFSKAVAHAGFRIDPFYSGGTVARSFDRTSAKGTYQVVVYQTVRPQALQRGEPFVQVAFRPVSMPGGQISEAVDLDGDGRPDVRINLTIPAGAEGRPGGSVVALHGPYGSFATPSDAKGRRGGGSFSELIARTGDTILVRVPLR